MKKFESDQKKSRRKYIFMSGIVIGFLIILGTNKAIILSSSNQYCSSCHSHPHAISSWKFSTHYDNPAGIVVKCVECHLSPGGTEYLMKKNKFGIKDVYGEFFKDTSEINWSEKSKLENAIKFTFKESCIKCHQNLFPLDLSKKGSEAHLYYTQIPDKIHCINCHLNVGHYSAETMQSENISFGQTSIESDIFNESYKVTSFNNYTDYIPGTNVSFDMVAINGGSFMMGSPENEKYRQADEGPIKHIYISPFFMGKIEVTWDAYIAFYNQTASGDRLSEKTKYNSITEKADAITGATPPYGPPDQGWGMGSRPAITMTHHAAEVYCKWLSLITGKKYRLPTESEWEYACRGGIESANFFHIEPKHFEGKSLLSRLFSEGNPDVDNYVIYAGNAKGKTEEPKDMAENPFGLVNMLGNVSEFCSDWYSSGIYAQISGKELTNPKGPANGEQYVIRGGSFRSTAKNIRSAARAHTETDKWLLTDPQIPKSIWWYSDCDFVGFRVVCEPDINILNPDPE